MPEHHVENHIGVPNLAESNLNSIIHKLGKSMSNNSK
jgi:hypothetical protein